MSTNSSRIYIDGGFDLLHSGHYNAIRQARAFGDVVVAGINSDADLLKNKGPTIMNCEERKWTLAIHRCKKWTFLKVQVQFRSRARSDYEW